MRFLETGFAFEEEVNGMEILKKIERAGRTCYKSENNITEESALKFVKMITHTYKHESVLEHASITVRIVCDRGISHEIVRHRIGAYSQESTRYCNYGKNKFGNEITVIRPAHLEHKSDTEQILWEETMFKIEENYFELLKRGWTPQEARGILPNELKTEMVVTYNMRQWRHFFAMRCGPAAHPQLRALTIPMLSAFKERIPVIFEDFDIDHKLMHASKDKLNVKI